MPAVHLIVYFSNTMTWGHQVETGRLFLEKLIYVLFMGEKMWTFVISAVFSHAIKTHRTISISYSV